MTDGNLEIHVLADSTGETAVRLARAARAQFPDAHSRSSGTPGWEAGFHDEGPGHP